MNEIKNDDELLHNFYLDDSTELKEKYDEMKDILKNFIKENENLPEQGSEEWLKIRTTCIGGSEMSVITGENKYSNLHTLVAQKIGLKKFTTNVACTWGNIFEPVTQKLSEITLGISNMSETSSLEGVIKEQRYSPDGLGIMKYRYVVNGKDLYTYHIVLFEYKSPYKTIPNGSIPKHYLPQVKTGLCSINISDFAIFVNNMYRKCQKRDLGFSLDYNDAFYKYEDTANITEVLAFGMVIFYQSSEQQEKFKIFYKEKYGEFSPSYESESCESVSELEPESSDSETDDDAVEKIMNNSDTEIPDLYYNIMESIYENSKLTIDFGGCYYYDINHLFNLYENKLISVKYENPCISDKYYEKEILKNQLRKNTSNSVTECIDEYNKSINAINGIIGYMSWKLFKSDIIEVLPENDYVEKLIPKIKEVVEIINDCNNSNSINEKKKKFKNHFPKCRISLN